MKDIALLHHSANPSNKHQAKQIIAQHLKEPTIRQAGAYHYVIEFDGLIVQLHPEEFIGYHAGNWKYNPRSIGICLAGDFTKHPVRPAQLDALTRLLSEIQSRWGIPDTNIKLHKEVRLNPTACPGVDLRSMYFAHRAKLLKTKIKVLQQATKRVKGPRLARIISLLTRLLSL